MGHIELCDINTLCYIASKVTNAVENAYGVIDVIDRFENDLDKTGEKVSHSAAIVESCAYRCALDELIKKSQILIEYCHDLQDYARVLDRER